MNNTFEDEYSKIWFSDGIFYSQVKTEVINLTAAEAFVKARIELTAGKPAIVLVDITNVRSISKEARYFLAEGEAIANIIAVAFYTQSVISKIIATFFLTFNKPKAPTKIFTTKADAIKWLEKFKS